MTPPTTTTQKKNNNKGGGRGEEERDHLDHTHKLVCVPETGLPSMVIQKMLLPHVGGGPYYKSLHLTNPLVPINHPLIPPTKNHKGSQVRSKLIHLVTHPKSGLEEVPREEI